jgi:hypothetical protein
VDKEKAGTGSGRERIIKNFEVVYVCAESCWVVLTGGADLDERWAANCG